MTVGEMDCDSEEFQDHPQVMEVPSPAVAEIDTPKAKTNGTPEQDSNNHSEFFVKDGNLKEWEISLCSENILFYFTFC